MKQQTFHAVIRINSTPNKESESKDIGGIIEPYIMDNKIKNKILSSTFVGNAYHLEATSKKYILKAFDLLNNYYINTIETFSIEFGYIPDWAINDEEDL